MDIKVYVPQSRLRRELNKWIRHIDNNPNAVIYITRNKNTVAVLVSPKYVDKLEG